MWVQALFLLLSRSSGNVAHCPLFGCAQLEENVCAHRANATNFVINEFGCSEKHICSAGYMMIWVRQTNSESLSHMCLPDPRVNGLPRPPANEPFACEERKSGKGFLAGGKVVVCQSDGDCQLQDGSFTQCQCAFRNDQLGICKPDLSNGDVFSGYWDDCGATNRISDFDRALYWWMMREMYVYLQTDLPCINNFMEMQMLREQEEKKQSP